MLLAERVHAFVRLGHLARKALLDAFGAGEALDHGRQLLAAGDDALLQFLKIAAQVREFFGSLRGFGFGSGADANRFGVLEARLLGARAGRFRFGMETRDFAALAIELQIHAKEFAARFIALVRGRDERFFRFHLLGGGGGKLHLARGGFFLEAGQLRLLFRGGALETRGFGFAVAEFALERQRSGLAFATTGHGAAVVAGTVRRQEIAVRIVVGHLLGDGDGFNNVGGAKFLQKIFGGGTERLAEFDEAVEARDEIAGHGRAIFHFVHVESASRIHEERRASTYFFAQQRDAGAGLIERFDDDVLELLAEKLLDRGFVFFLDFGVVGEQAEGAEASRRGVAIRIEELLHGIGRVGALAKNLFDGGVPGALGGQFLAHLLELLAGFLLGLTKAREARLRFTNRVANGMRVLFGLREGRVGGIHARLKRRAFLLDGAHGGGALLFGGGVAGCGFLGLLRFGLAARGFLDESVGEAAKFFHTRFEPALAGGACGNVFGGFAQARFEGSSLAAERGD